MGVQMSMGLMSVCTVCHKVLLLWIWNEETSVSGFHVGKLQSSQQSSAVMCRGLPQRLTDEEVEARVSCMPGPLAKVLLPFQRDGVRFGVQHKGRLLLADEMGVGKTVQAIALASCYQVRAACTKAVSPDQ